MSEDKITSIDKNGDVVVDKKKLREEAANKTLDKVLRGVNDTFTKHYKFEELGLEFDIKVRYPNKRDSAKINSMREDLLDGTGTYQNYMTRMVYQTLCMLSVVGIDVPDYFDLDGYARDDVTYEIGEDINDWLNSFRG